VANHYQYGNSNKATTQLGFRNLDNILQEGNMNISYTTQTGTTAGYECGFTTGNNNNSNVTQNINRIN
jgi:hypothetical protein